MAAKEARIPISPDIAKALQDMRRLQDQLRGVGRGAKTAESGMTRMGGAGMRAAASMALRFISFGAILAGIRKAARAVGDEMKRLDDISKAHTRGLAAAAYGAGDIKHLGRLRKELLELSKHGISPEEATQVYARTRGALPSAPISRVLDIVKTAAIAKPSAADIPELASLMAELEKTVPGMPLGRQLNRAMFVQQQAGRFGTKFGRRGMASLRQFVAARGADDNAIREGIGLMLASLEAGGSFTAFEGLSEAISETKTPAELKAIAKDRTKRHLLPYYKATPGARLEMLRQNRALREAVLPAGERLEMEALLARQPEELRKGVQRAEESTLYAQANRDAMRDPAWAARFAIERRKAQAEALDIWKQKFSEFTNVELRSAEMRKAGVPVVPRKILEWAGEVKAGLGLESGTEDIEAAAQAERAAAGIAPPPGPAPPPAIPPEGIGAGGRITPAPLDIDAGQFPASQFPASQLPGVSIINPTNVYMTHPTSIRDNDYVRGGRERSVYG